jgi:hypothetical protein
MKTYGAGGREPSEVRTNSVVDVSNLMITLAARKSTFLRRAYRAHGFSAPDGTCDISTSAYRCLATISSAVCPFVGIHQSRSSHSENHFLEGDSPFAQLAV